MAATAGVATPIVARRVGQSAQGNAYERRLSEKAAQTFLIGTPVAIDPATGFVYECPAIVSVATAVVAGVSVENASNLTTSGVPKTITLPNAPQNQPSAVIIPGGVPPNDGTVGFVVADDATEFIGVLGGSVTDADGTIAQTDLGALFGLTKDATTNYWYVDKDKTTAAGGWCVVITGFVDPVGTLHGRVIFRFIKAAQQLSV